MLGGQRLREKLPCVPARGWNSALEAEDPLFSCEEGPGQRASLEPSALPAGGVWEPAPEARDRARIGANRRGGSSTPSPRVGLWGEFSSLQADRTPMCQAPCTCFQNGQRLCPSERGAELGDSGRGWPAGPGSPGLAEQPRGSGTHRRPLPLRSPKTKESVPPTERSLGSPAQNPRVV